MGLLNKSQCGETFKVPVHSSVESDYTFKQETDSRM